MSFQQTIAAKIFGLAVFLLLLTIALAGFLLHEVTRTKEALEVVAHFDIPLTQSVAQLDQFGLRRRLAFERWFGALNAVDPNQEIISEASANYALFTESLPMNLPPPDALLASTEAPQRATKRWPR